MVGACKSIISSSHPTHSSRLLQFEPFSNYVATFLTRLEFEFEDNEIESRVLTIILLIIPYLGVNGDFKRQIISLSSYFLSFVFLVFRHHKMVP